MRNESRILADMLDLTRNLTLDYLEKLKGKDLHRIFKTESGEPLNSAYWTIAHVTVTENWLVLFSTFGIAERLAWGKQFAIGSQPSPIEDLPPFEEISEKFNNVHKRSLEHILSLSEEDLSIPTKYGNPFGTEDSCRNSIMHAVRHEASHAGHLSWLCKMHGVKTM